MEEKHVIMDGEVMNEKSSNLAILSLCIITVHIMMLVLIIL